MSPPEKKAPTEAEMQAIEKIARAMTPEEWGNGICTNQAGWAIRDGVIHAKRLIRAYPGIVDLVNSNISNKA